MANSSLPQRTFTFLEIRTAGNRRNDLAQVRRDPARNNVTRFVIAIGQFEYRSDDDGRNWVRSLRQIPPKYSPIVHGDIEPAGLPLHSDDFRWDFVTVLACGFGIV